MADDEKPVVKEEKKKVKKGKKAHKNKPLGKKYEHYKIEGSTLKRDKYCPRCGAGVFLAQHGNRSHCGRCNYTEFNAKK